MAAAQDVSPLRSLCSVQKPINGSHINGSEVELQTATSLPGSFLKTGTRSERTMTSDMTEGSEYVAGNFVIPSKPTEGSGTKKSRSTPKDFQMSKPTFSHSFTARYASAWT
eukprot:9050763-Heterocapsa_arctica.AAC.1